MQLYTVADVSRDLRVHKNTAYKLIGRGDIPSVRVGKCVRVRAEELEEYLTRRAEN